MAFTYVIPIRVRHDTLANDPAAVSSSRHKSLEAEGRGETARAIARRRVDATCRGIAACIGPDGQWIERGVVNVNDKPEPRLKIGDAWLHHMKAHGARIRANANMALHLLAGVSSEWVEEAGRLHDSENPRNVDLFEHAIEWARGAGLAPYAARLDLDEKGGGEVDLFCAPIRQQGRRNSRRNFVAVTQALNEIGSKHKQYRSYSGLQDSWHQYAVRHLSPELERGKPPAAIDREDPSAMDEIATKGGREMRDMLAEARELNRDSDRMEEVAELARDAIRDAADILQSIGDEALLPEADALAKDASAAVDGDADAIARLRRRPKDNRLAQPYAR